MRQSLDDVVSRYGKLYHTSRAEVSVQLKTTNGLMFKSDLRPKAPSATHYCAKWAALWQSRALNAARLFSSLVRTI
jgi:hypothetical protein